MGFGTLTPQLRHESLLMRLSFVSGLEALFSVQLETGREREMGSPL